MLTPDKGRIDKKINNCNFCLQIGFDPPPTQNVIFFKVRKFYIYCVPKLFPKLSEPKKNPSLYKRNPLKGFLNCLHPL